MARWVRTSNCFISRFTIDPARRAEFLEALEELCRNADPWYDEGCHFAFQGWARNPDQWVAVACWKSEDFLTRMRATSWFQDCQRRMLECCVQAMVMEEISGMEEDRSVFDRYPAGRSTVHALTRDLDVVFL
ncbi:MAG TPA: hypothetical protein VJM11_04665 [Nevskiaceae bacterium]|nr:hypothetical protein [Nevskiaceae bacterium]